MKTLAIRLEDEQHARLSILAKLSGVSVTDAIRSAIEAQITTLAANKDLAAHAKSALEEIERDAEEQRSAIAALFGDGTKTTTSSRSPRAKS